MAVIPTTAGSGAEVTSNAVIYVDGIKEKGDYFKSNNKPGTDIKFGPNEGRCKVNLGENFSKQLQN